MESAAPLAFSDSSRLCPTSPRTASRSGSEDSSSVSYPQLLIAVSTTNKASLLLRVTGSGVWANPICAQRTSAATSEDRNVEVRQVLPRENRASGLQWLHRSGSARLR